jgi:hypothetical protein
MKIKEKHWRPKSSRLARFLTAERRDLPNARYSIYRHGAFLGQYVKGGFSDGEIIVSALSLDDAVATARALCQPGAGTWAGEWDNGIVAFYETRDRKSGSFEILRMVPSKREVLATMKLEQMPGIQQRAS